MRNAAVVGMISMVVAAGCGDDGVGPVPVEIPAERAAAIDEQVSDILIRVLPALSDQGAAQRMAVELRDLAAASGRRDGATVVAVASRARDLVSRYGLGNGAALSDAPDLEVIRSAVEYALSATSVP